VGVAALFFLNGSLFAAWVSRLPAIQLRHGLSNGALGLALLVVALGAVIAMPLAGWLISRTGSAKVCKAATLLYGAALPALVFAPDLPLFALTLLAFGASHGALDVAMNAQAVAVERRYERPIMSSFHAFFSAGGFVGAAIGAVLAAHELRPLIHLSIVALASGVGALFIFPHLLGSTEQEPSASVSTNAAFPWRQRGLLALGAIALCTMMGEGAMADWTAVYLRNQLRTTESFAAIGYAAFSIAMLAGRFGGNYLTTRIGPLNLVRISGTLSAIGLTSALIVKEPAPALFGFACVGAGFATVVPIVFSAAGRSKGVSPGMAIASVTTLGYLGFLAGPPLIGFLAEVFGLRYALGVIIATSLLTVVLASAVKEPG
jgi:predicted MFS family arabinose efflux permease